MILAFEQDLVVFWILDYGNWSGKNGKELGFLCFLQVVFKHENHGSPPSLSCAGKMRSGQKYELVQLLEASTTVECPDVDVNVFDAAAVVNMLPPGKSRTFKDYATSVFLNYIIKQAQNIKHLALQELWFSFGVGNHFRYLPIHKITTSLTEQQCEALPFFMLTQGVILSYTLREKERRQLSKRGSQILKSMKSFVSYHLLEIQSLKNSVVSWSNLWLSCTAIRVPTRQSTKLDKFYLRKVMKPLRTFLQLKPLLHSTSKEQPIRPVMYGVKRWNLCRNSQVRQSGAGCNHQKVGLPSGLC